MPDPAIAAGTSEIKAELLDFGLPSPTLVARIWATVDLDRVLEQLGLSGVELPSDGLLGARVHLVSPANDSPIAIVEPIAEAPLTGWLARYGEGEAGAYLAWDLPFEDVLDRIDRGFRLTTSRIAKGPFGSSSLLLMRQGLGSLPMGPLLVIVERPAATIEP